MIPPAHTATPYDLLSTKLSIPRLGSPRVQRGELLARLDAGLQQPLTLLSAPAGFGKTTLVVEWVEALTTQAGDPGSRSGPPVTGIAWVSLDPGDNDPLRFWRYILTAVQFYDPEAGTSALSVLHAAQQAHFEAVLTALINALDSRPGKALLVLEDYHAITNPQIHASLAFLLGHLPPALHLVLLTRSDPPLPLARLRARNEVNELRAPDLRFSQAETGAFLHQAVPHPLSPQTAVRLAARTEGWPAGLRLVALALQGRQEPGDQEQFLDTFTGSHRSILEFLVADVLACQAESIQDFCSRPACSTA
jgi:LuxR family maltose regulon positive regulatory protein